MTAPVRLQLSRRKGFDLQAVSRAANGLPAVVVARPTKWGNPFVVGRDGTRAECVSLYGHMLAGYYALTSTTKLSDLAAARDHVVHNLAELRGKNLACWCRGAPCHADVLLEIANRPACEEVRP